MKKLLNTLYVTRQETYLHKDRETIILKQGDEKLGQFPALTISNILCFGLVTVSPPLMGYCGENGIGLSFYSEIGKFLARIQGKQTGNVLLRRTQYRIADDQNKALEIVRIMLAAKIANSRYVLLRNIRNHGENALLENVAKQLAASQKRCQTINTLQMALGVEGEAAATYFSVFNELLRDSDFSFNGRVRRPANRSG